MNSERWFAACAMSLALAACGGGGGGSEAPAPAPALASLIPAAPALGATLEADAAVLRPLRDGAVWRYRGTETVRVGAAPVAYETATTQTLATGSSTATEATSNSGNGGTDASRLSVAAGGSVVTQESIDFAGKGVAELVSLVELRSPVRQGDQATVLDKRYTDTAYDVDRDGRTDILDVAVYSRVIGTETVALVDLPALQTIRVDTVIRLRFTSSASGVASPVIESTLQTWYAPRIGIVRQLATTPGATDSDVAVTDERLVSWDGVSAGFGPMATADAAVATGALAGQTLLAGGNLRAFAFADHALVFSGVRGGSAALVASTFDLRGRITASKTLTGVVVRQSSTIAQLTNGLVLLDESPTGSSTLRQLTRLASDGTVLGSATLNLAGNRLVPSVGVVGIAGDGDRAWLIFTRGYRDTDPLFTIRGETVLRAYAADGTPVTPEFVLAGASAGKLQARGGRLLLSWIGPAPGYAVNLGLIDSATGQLAPVTTLADGLSGSNSSVVPLLLESGSAAIWSSALGSGAAQPFTSVLRLDAGLGALPAGPTLAAAQISGLPTFDSLTAAPVAAGSRIVFATHDLGSTAIFTAGGSTAARVSWLETGSLGPLTSAALSAVRFTPPVPVAPVAQAVFSDRVLVFSGDDTLRSTLVWLNSGKAP